MLRCQWSNTKWSFRESPDIELRLIYDIEDGQVKARQAI
ncbi:hypothetical protein PITC_085090 [Penicillium italicum]|uniref:Uncharacterized protein n=1 Tax=Penicillium italicum TaxID=40296 RepID=A0A0A2L2H7_PENIT|nr:hypothetical protein PITC_085090 [Penicillium italicum]